MNSRQALDAAEALTGPVREVGPGCFSFDTFEIPTLRIVPAERSVGWRARPEAHEARGIVVQRLADRLVTRMRPIVPALAINAELAPDY